MIVPNKFQISLVGPFRNLAIVGIVFALLALIAALAFDVRNRLAALDLADSDNGQWVMMQTEVEVLRLQSTLIKAQLDQADLTEVRRWFNVLYSRLHMLEQSPLYADFIQKPEQLARLKAMQAFSDRWVNAVDSTDEVLREALPQIESESSEVQRLARALSLDSLLVFSASTDETRARVSDTLLVLAIAISTTILLLAVLAVTATRLYQTTRRQAQENQIAGDRLQLIIATSPDAIVVTNRGGWVVEFNPVAEAMFGLTRDQVLGKWIVPILFPNQHRNDYVPRLRNIITRAASSGPQRFEIMGQRTDGTPFPLEVSLAVRDLNRGALVVNFLRDVSQRKEVQQALEQALTQAQAGEKAKADFLAVMSHEMRTPLNGLIGSMDLMRDTAMDEGQRELLRVMEVSGEILLGHVDSVLDISRSEGGQIRLSDTPFVLDRLIEDCIANQAGVARTGGNTIRHVALSGTLGAVHGDPGRLQQILLNLIGNAVKFTRDGSITVESERLPQRPDSAAPQVFEIRVIDTGIGIAKEDRSRVFEDFATVDSSYGRTAGGTGLGLGIARRLAQAMGGSIGVESETGMGSVFWLRLPLPAAEPFQTAPTLPRTSDTPLPSAMRRLNVLVIEDNSINRFLLRRMLCEQHHSVTEAIDGQDGVAAAEKTAFDLIITDISMPRLDGLEAARRIRAGGASAKARIIALTAHALPEDLERFRLAGMDACLTKPVSRKALRAQVYAGDDAPLFSHTNALPQNTALQDLVHTLGQPLALSLINRMLAEGDATIAAIKAQPGPNDEMARAAHLMAGSCPIFGATAMCAALSGLEQAIKVGKLAQASDIAALVPDIWNETRHDLTAQYALLVA
ncbi:MAG: ATP-binding protein [Pseudotabrizicola sp.]|uniref:ATP-binding protein n=1 Tax=Pseudotabrizicola sp. TaxID=2939647 RepID=UPI0027303617|nr:ATP-binding protein [Pseudotabrizicola sp.]MDZ7575644.1 ATP-binding protein [Pseudotabrizicola sp.]